MAILRIEKYFKIVYNNVSKANGGKFNEMEIWLDVQGYEGIYQVSNLGRVKRIYNKSEKIIEGTLVFGYRIVALYKNRVKSLKRVHRLVAEAFIPNPQNYPHINHKDWNPNNNCVDNLEWCTDQYNNAHRSNCLIYKG